LYRALDGSLAWLIVPSLETNVTFWKRHLRANGLPCVAVLRFKRTEGSVHG
jgi:hypothetical protein